MTIRSLKLISANSQSATCTELSRSIRNPKLLLLCTLLLAPCFSVQAQPTKIPRIGYPAGISLSALSARNEAFRRGLRELAYVEGKNIVIEWRFAEGKMDRLPDLAVELVRMNVDVIVVGGGNAALAAKNATSTIPIVIAAASDPVGTGLVTSLARPRGNITGLTVLSPELSGKRLELLKEAVPGITRVAALVYPDNPAYRVRSGQVLDWGNPIDKSLWDTKMPFQEACFTEGTLTPCFIVSSPGMKYTLHSVSKARL